MKRYALAAISLTAAFGLMACGDDTTTNNYSSTEIEDIISKNLPECEKTNQGKIFFVSDKSELQICMDNNWMTLNGAEGLKGETGEKGEQGEQGVKGDDGASCEAAALEDKSGYKILCGGDSVGVVLNGEKGDVGPKGDKGEQGEEGLNGASCQMTAFKDKGDTAAMVICQKDTVYLMNGKDAVSGSGTGEGSETGTGEGGGPQTTLTEGSMPNGLVIIGDQVWQGQNVNDATKGGACYDNEEENCAVFGRLYTWAEAMAIDTSYNNKRASTTLIKKNHQGICPDGFHVPTLTDWQNLDNYVNGTDKAKAIRTKNGIYDNTDVSGILLRSTEYDGNDIAVWTTASTTTNGQDAYGFMVVGSGSGKFNWLYNDDTEEYDIADYGDFGDIQEKSKFWTVQQDDGSENAFAWEFHHDNSGSVEDWWNKNRLYSVRCMMNMSATDYMKTEEYKALFTKTE